MNIEAFLADLTTRGVELWAEEDRLKFRAPKGVMTSALAATLKRYKQEVIQRVPPHASQAISYPLSYNQKALLFLHQLAPESPAYNACFSAQIKSPIEVPAFREALRVMVARHPSWRTTFALKGDELLQVMHPTLAPDFVQIDASAWTAGTLKKRRLETYQHPFDLEKGPLLRVHLYSRTAKDHILELIFHQITCDGWSLHVLVDELGIAYAAEVEGRAAPLSPLQCTYRDFVTWQEEMLATQGEHHWRYWQHQLQGDLPILNLPTDRPRPPVQTFRGASHSFKLGEDLTQDLRSLSQTEGTSLFTILAATLLLFLHRYTAQEDILLGTPIAARSQDRFSRIIGDFVNTVVLRSSLSGNPQFRAFLHQTRQTILQAMAHQDYPFPLLVEQLQVKRDPSRTPVFQILFNFIQPHEMEGRSLLSCEDLMEWGGLSFQPLQELEIQEGQFDLSVWIVEREQILLGAFKYNSELFSTTTIARFAQHFQTLLSAVVAHPHERVRNLSLLSGAEQQRLLQTWHSAQFDYPHALCLHHLVEEQVHRTPDAMAVAFEGYHLTYQQLNERSDQLAYHLQSLGVNPETLVGICVERSLDMVVGLLGILKAGGAYVPLDPHYPPERIAYILTDANVQVLLTQDELLASLPQLQTTIVCLDTLGEESPPLQPLPAANASQATPLAYVIYTSGSTGQPKGVQIEHRSLVNLLTSMRCTTGITEQDVCLAVTTISFDIAALEIFLPLMVGATVVIAPHEVASDGFRLQRTLMEAEVTVMQATPATWRLLLATGWAGNSHLKALCGGEALTPSLAWDLLEKVAVLWNLYGPTETTIWSAAFSITKESLAADHHRGYVPIGYPIHNTQLYILDADLNLLPVGAIGEICIGGDGLSRGYWHLPELTAQKFVANPFGPGRLYRTGDLGRYLVDDRIEFLGRLDHQVKVRGYRIELGEIESVLEQHPQVQQAVVMTQEEAENKFLVAYIIPAAEKTLTAEALRTDLKRIIPDYMVPAVFIPVESLPLTPNGKIDRRALPLVFFLLQE
jgi:amino acid adenylation domain-containing protein